MALADWAETATRHVLDQRLQAFNSADRARVTAFWQVYNPVWTQIDRELPIRKESGGFTLMKVTCDGGANLDATVTDAGCFCTKFAATALLPISLDGFGHFISLDSPGLQT